jgi:hypothetical protein
VAKAERSYLHIEHLLGLKAGIVEVEVVVPTAERRPMARVVEQPCHLTAKVLPVRAPREHRLGQLRLPRHELLGLLRVRVLQPER